MSKSKPDSDSPTLRFMPDVWHRIVSARDAVDTEIGIYLIPHVTDRLLIVDIMIPHQLCMTAHCRLDADPAAIDVMRMEMELESLGYTDPGIFERYWLHTHPGGMSPNPSSEDIGDFRRRQKIGHDTAEPGAGYPYLVHVILNGEGSTWARIDLRVEGTDEWIEIPMHCVLTPRIPCAETVALAQSRVSRDTPPPVYSPRVGHYYQNGHGQPAYAPASPPPPADASAVIPRDIDSQDAPLTRREKKARRKAQRQSLYSESLLTADEEKRLTELCQIGTHDLSNEAYAEYERLCDRALGVIHSDGYYRRLAGWGELRSDAYDDALADDDTEIAEIVLPADAHNG